jgi:hypothetical protein
MKRSIFIFLLALSFTACKKDGGPESTSDPLPQGNLAITAVGQTTGIKIEKQIGSSGGTLSSADGKLSLVIPAGALESDQNISMQSIENKAPLGIGGFAVRLLPHGLQFKKDISLVVKYTDEDLIGTAPELLKLATQTTKGSWKKEGQVSVNKTAKTITASFNHFSDHSIYTEYSLQTKQTTSDTALIHVFTSQQVDFTVVHTMDAGDGLLLPLLPGGEVISWSVNNIENPSPLDNLGGFVSSGQNANHLAQRNYEAPRRAPSPSKVTISVKLNLGNLGQLFILRYVQISDLNQFSLNGKTYDKAVPSAIIIDASNLLSLGMLESIGNKTAGVGISIENLNTAPGTYQFTGSEDVLITAHDENGNQWSSQKFTLTGTIYTGAIELTISGTAPNRYITGKITGTLFGSGSTTQGAPINAVFGVKGF